MKSIIVRIVVMCSALAIGACSGAQTRADDEAVEASDFHYQLSIGHWRANEVPTAIRELNTALGLNADNVQALFMLGFIYQGRRNYAEAERLYLRAIELAPERYDIQNNLGVIYLEQERWLDAEEVFRALTAAPTYTTPGHAYNNLGWALFQQRFHAEALENFDLAILFQPEHCLAYNNKGLVLEELRNYRPAVGAYDEAITRCEDYQEPYYRLAMLLIRLDRETERAFELLDSCVEMGENTPIGMRCFEYVAGDDGW